VPLTVSRTAPLPPGSHVTWDRTELAGFKPADARITLNISASDGLDTVGLQESLQSSVWGDSNTLAA
ncbi:hypothetical protein, partial [Gluconobacter kondonii]|uniref:hypothetical protein n=1 Tax=Gluconobacter kondonii TaxID=941463 RepID=UPI00222FEC98